MRTHKLPGKESIAHEMCAQIFLKMKSRCHLQVFWQGIGEGNSPRRKEKEEEKKMPIMGSSENAHTVNSSLPASTLCTSRMFHLMCPRLPFTFLPLRLGLEIMHNYFAFNSSVDGIAFFMVYRKPGYPSWTQSEEAPNSSLPQLSEKAFPT